ncbi:MAG: apolipoprotein N-acyltransferase [Acidimicrobiia bacterium]|nr:apolipoprotein N-acyltransferase [Acidimicrobiia bacterium]
MTGTPATPGATVAERRWLRPGAALVSGLLVGLAFPPFDLGPLVLVALVPLLWAWRDAGPRRAAWLGFLAGLGFFGVLLSWAWYLGAVALVPLVGIMAATWALTGLGVGLLGRVGVRSAWATAAVWVLVEGLRGRWPLGGFPWGEVGAALHDVPTARALASWGGVLLVSFTVVAVNGFLVELLLADRPAGTWRAPAAGLGVLLALTLVAGMARVEGRPSGTLRFALLQGNDLDRDLTPEEADARYLPRSHLRLASTLEGPYDLVVFPESSLDADPERDAALRAELVAVGERHGAAVLVNAVTRDDEGDAFNTNLLYDPGGRLQGTYAKQHLVPFGEYVPLRDHLGFIRELEQVPTDYTPGPGNVVFEVAGRRVGTIICFESAFGPLVRSVVRDGAEVVVVSTNNRSYRRSGNPAQHLALSQMRAAETGRPVLHASISGITGVIDAEGDVRQTTSLFESSVVTGEVVTTTGRTPYVRYGSWILVLSALVVVGLAGRARLRGRRRRGPGLASPGP